MARHRHGLPATQTRPRLPPLAGQARASLEDVRRDYELLESRSSIEGRTATGFGGRAVVDTGASICLGGHRWHGPSQWELLVVIQRNSVECDRRRPL